MLHCGASYNTVLRPRVAVWCGLVFWCGAARIVPCCELGCAREPANICEFNYRVGRRGGKLFIFLFNDDKYVRSFVAS